MHRHFVSFHFHDHFFVSCNLILFDRTQLHFAPFGSNTFHITPCDSISLYVIPCHSTSLHVIPCRSMPLHFIPHPAITGCLIHEFINLLVRLLVHSFVRFRLSARCSTWATPSVAKQADGEPTMPQCFSPAYAFMFTRGPVAQSESGADPIL